MQILQAVLINVNRTTGNLLRQDLHNSKATPIIIKTSIVPSAQNVHTVMMIELRHTVIARYKPRVEWDTSLVTRKLAVAIAGIPF